MLRTLVVILLVLGAVGLAVGDHRLEAHPLGLRSWHRVPVDRGKRAV